MSPYCYEMKQDFKQLLKNITPNRKFLREVREAIRDIFEHLKKYCRDFDIRIGKTVPSGSIAKNTAIMFETDDGDEWVPDLDLVLFLNDEYPEFAAVYESIKQILEEMEEVSEIEVKKYSIRFVYSTETQGDIQVDLLAATNRVQNGKDYDDVGKEEARRAMISLGRKQWPVIEETGEVDTEENHLCSAAFALLTVDIIREYVSDPLLLNVVKLAKFWSALIEYPDGQDRFPPRSCMIELVAIFAQRNNQEWKSNKCVVSGFVRFLQAMARLKWLDISLNPQKGPTWNYSTPMVVDPVNYFNNLADGLQNDIINVLMSQAKKTLGMIRRFKRSEDYERIEDAIDDIFNHKD